MSYVSSHQPLWFLLSHSFARTFAFLVDIEIDIEVDIGVVGEMSLCDHVHHSYNRQKAWSMPLSMGCIVDLAHILMHGYSISLSVYTLHRGICGQWRQGFPLSSLRHVFAELFTQVFPTSTRPRTSWGQLTACVLETFIRFCTGTGQTFTPMGTPQKKWDVVIERDGRCTVNLVDNK